MLKYLLVLDPVLKLEYLETAWEAKYVKAGMERFKSQVIKCLDHFIVVVHDIFYSFLFIRPNMKQPTVNLSYRLPRPVLLVRVLFVICLLTSWMLILIL